MRSTPFAVIAVLLAATANAQDWRTSGEDPCACTDSMPFIIGPRPPVTTPSEIAAMVRDSGSDACRVSRIAVETLRDAKNDASATKALLAALKSKACAIRASAAYSLIRHNDPAIPAAVADLLHDADRRVRQAAAYTLGRHPHPPALPTLVKLLDDPSKHVRQAAVESLGRAGDPSFRPAVVALLDDPEPHVRHAAKEALARLEPRR